MKKTLISILLTLILIIGTVGASFAAPTRFSDVTDSSKYYYTPVYWAVQQNITKGYAGNKFKPQKECSRKEMVIFLWRLAGRPSATGNMKFTDVKYAKNTDSYKAILWGTSKGIIKGYAGNRFMPDNTVNRKDTMIMLYRFAGKPAVNGPMKFSDCNDYKPSSDTYKAIIWGTNKAITKGYTDGAYKGLFRPSDDCLREHIVTFIYRYKHPASATNDKNSSAVNNKVTNDKNSSTVNNKVTNDKNSSAANNKATSNKKSDSKQTSNNSTGNKTNNNNSTKSSNDKDRSSKAAKLDLDEAKPMSSNTIPDGVYIIAMHNYKWVSKSETDWSWGVLDIEKASKTSGAKISESKKNGNRSQLWKITGLGNGLYKIVNVNSGLALSVKDGTVYKLKPDDGVRTITYNGKKTYSKTQECDMYVHGKFVKTLKNEVKSPKPLTDAQKKQVYDFPDTVVQQTKWSNKKEQKWKIKKVNTKYNTGYMISTALDDETHIPWGHATNEHPEPGVLSGTIPTVLFCVE